MGRPSFQLEFLAFFDKAVQHVYFYVASWDSVESCMPCLMTSQYSTLPTELNEQPPLSVCTVLTQPCAQLQSLWLYHTHTPLEGQPMTPPLIREL